ncbi:uncharacterized protein PAC_13195 [Phialocephala subalpina]|uniref:Uncharacterized protein n=1 Tax=Phialocephala subalpina TaxID=576137 RepID=A0A1L7XE63_9HELO|nr:uncharacterized protein PAC_13195 [Phialocephala subalpina]
MASTMFQTSHSFGNDGTGLVLIDQRSIFMCAAGTRASSAQPAIIIETGSSGTSSGWIAVQRLLSAFSLAVSYDRAGYGKSKTPGESPTASQPLTATKRCEELTKLLECDRADKFPDGWPTLLADASYFDVVGLEKNRVLSYEEWAELKKNDEGNEPTVALEEASMKASTDKVNEKVAGKQAFGDGRLSVIFANESVEMRKGYDWGVEHGNSTAEAREALRKRLEDMAEVDEKGQRAHLSMSSHSKFVYAEGDARTQSVQVVNPQLIVDEVRWVLEGARRD